MRLSSPVFQLKRRARAISREQNVPLHEALDLIAVSEGFASWSLLAARVASNVSPQAELMTRLNPGELLLLGARPGQGKTMLALGLMVEAVRRGQYAKLYTLEFTESECLKQLSRVDDQIEKHSEFFEVDTSDCISADYIIAQSQLAQPETLVVVDYLQLLDQKRNHPQLAQQILQLKTFAMARGVIVVFLSQIDRSFNSSVKPMPTLNDVRMPNPLDLNLFDKTCFISNGEFAIGET